MGSPVNPKTLESTSPILQTPHPNPIKKESQQPRVRKKTHQTTFLKRISTTAINHSSAGALSLKNDDNPRNKRRWRIFLQSKSNANVEDEVYLAAAIGSHTQPLRQRRRHRAEKKLRQQCRPLRKTWSRYSPPRKTNQETQRQRHRKRESEKKRAHLNSRQQSRAVVSSSEIQTHAGRSKTKSSLPCNAIKCRLVMDCTTASNGRPGILSTSNSTSRFFEPTTGRIFHNPSTYPPV